MDTGHVEYSVLLKILGNVLIPSEEMRTKWPKALQKFLERQIEFTRGDRGNSLIHKFGRLTNITDAPIRVLACSNYDGLVYLCEWRNSLTKYVVTSTIAHAEFPNLVNDFLESRLNFNDCGLVSPFINGKYLFSFIKY